VCLSEGTAKEGNIETWLWCTVTCLARGSLEGSRSNLERCYIIVHLAVSLPHYRDKLEFVPQTWDVCDGGGGA
jgi:hypothetical protein